MGTKEKPDPLVAEALQLIRQAAEKHASNVVKAHEAGGPPPEYDEDLATFALEQLRGLRRH